MAAVVLPFTKQDLPLNARGLPSRVSSAASVLNPENVCKWRALNSLFQPDDKEWQAAAAAPSWESDDIVKRIRVALDSEWAIEQARAARHAAEAKKTAERVQKQHKRTQSRFAAMKPVRELLKKYSLVIIHEATKEDTSGAELAAQNPLSLQYAGRPTRKRKSTSPSESESPEVEREVLEEAAALGVQLVSPHKKKRQALRDADPKAVDTHSEHVQAAKEAFRKLSPAEKEAVLKSLAANKQAEEETARGASTAATGGGMTAEDTDREREAKAKADKKKKSAYYKRRLDSINGVRAGVGQGKLNKESRDQLRVQCAHHYKDAESAFAGSALLRGWWTEFMENMDKHPAAAEGEVESAEEE